MTPPAVVAGAPAAINGLWPPRPGARATSGGARGAGEPTGSRGVTGKRGRRGGGHVALARGALPPRNQNTALHLAAALARQQLRSHRIRRGERLWGSALLLVTAAYRERVKPVVLGQRPQSHSTRLWAVEQCRALSHSHWPTRCGAVRAAVRPKWDGNGRVGLGLMTPCFERESEPAEPV